MFSIYVQSSELSDNGYVILKTIGDLTDDEIVYKKFRAVEGKNDKIVRYKDIFAIKQEGIQKDTNRICSTTILVSGLAAEQLDDSASEELATILTDFYQNNIDSLKNEYSSQTSKSCCESSILDSLRQILLSKKYPDYIYKKNSKTKIKSNSRLTCALVVVFILIMLIIYNNTTPISDNDNDKKTVKIQSEITPKTTVVTNTDIRWANLNENELTKNFTPDQLDLWKYKKKNGLIQKAIYNKQIQYILIKDKTNLEKLFRFSEAKELIPDKILSVRKSLKIFLNTLQQINSIADDNSNINLQNYGVLSRINKLKNSLKECGKDIANLDKNYSIGAPFFSNEDIAIANYLYDIIGSEDAIVKKIIPVSKSNYWNKEMSLIESCKTLNDNNYKNTIIFNKKMLEFASQDIQNKFWLKNAEDLLSKLEELLVTLSAEVKQYEQ